MHSPHEINRVAIHAQSGDEAAVNKILEYFEETIKKITRNYFISGAEKEDVVQVARIALWEAIKTYDPSYNVNFQYFARGCIKRHIVSAFKEARKKRNDPLNFGESLDAPINIDKDGSTAYDIHSNDSSANIGEKISTKNEVEWLDIALKKRLTKLEQDSYDKYKLGYTYREIASQLKRTEKTIDNALMRVRTKAQCVIKQYIDNIKMNEGIQCSLEFIKKWDIE